jgi:hypothetical protein
MVGEGHAPVLAVLRAHAKVYVSRLRHELPAGVIESRAGDYALLIDGERLDLRVFEQAATEGRTALVAGDCERAAELLRHALALWRGPALAGLSSDALRREAERLEELRLHVLEDRLEADLARGSGRLAQSRRDRPKAKASPRSGARWHAVAAGGGALLKASTTTSTATTATTPHH